MANLMILSPAGIDEIAVSRGSGAANLLTPDPREVWADSTTGTAATIDIDLGAARPIDTVYLGHVRPPAADATWTIQGGTASYTATTIKASGPLRANDATGQAPELSHALWHGDPVNVRLIRISVTQPAGDPLTAGVVMAGSAFVPTWNMEWGAGRRPIDLSTVTQLVTGGFGIVEGARKAGFSWTLGDLTDDEVEALYAIAIERGASLPVLVVEDPAATAGLRNRIHYGLFESFRKYERRLPGKTVWELGIEQWI